MKYVFFSKNNESDMSFDETVFYRIYLSNDSVNDVACYSADSKVKICKNFWGFVNLRDLLAFWDEVYIYHNFCSPSYQINKTFFQSHFNL